MTTSSDTSPSDAKDARAISPRLLAIVVVVCSIAAFLVPIDGPWIFDDHVLIARNHFVHGFAHWRHWFSSALWSTNVDAGAAKRYLALWRPAVLATFSFDWWLGKGSPFVFHVTNLIAHAIASVLAFLTLKRWSRSAGAAFVGALIFSLHPTKVESVAWIAGRTDVFCTVGIFVAMLGAKRRLERRRYGVALEVVGAAIAYLSKEQAVVLPAFVAVEAWAMDRKLDAKTIARATAPHVITALVYLAARKLFLPIGHAHAPIAFTTHAAYVLESLGRYLVLTVWPGDLSLGRAQRSVVDGVPTPAASYVVLGAVTLVALVAAVWACRRRAQGISAGLILFAVALLPVCNVVWIGYLVLISPRFLYLPLFGLAFVACEIAVMLGSRLPLSRVAWAVVIVALGARTIERSTDFGSEDAFWSYELAHNPSYSPALVYRIDSELNRGRPHAALRDAIAAHEQLRVQAPTDANRGEITRVILQATLVLIPDLARDALVAVRAFVADVRNGRDARLSLPPLGLELLLGAHDSEAYVTRERSTLWLDGLDGEIASRLGDDASALRSANRIAVECVDCSKLLYRMAGVAARAGDLDLATRLLTSLRSVEWTADADHLSRDVDRARLLVSARKDAGESDRTIIDTQYFALFGAWGRAYHAAKAAIAAADSLAPESAQSLGDLCFRAGDSTTAKKLLARAMPAADVQRRLDALALEMHWVDAPLDEATPK